MTPKVRVESFAISLDGFGAGPDQGPDNPNGIGGLAVHDWAFGTRTFQAMFGKDGGATGTDDDFAPFHCPVFVLTHHPRASVEM